MKSQVYAQEPFQDLTISTLPCKMVDDIIRSDSPVFNVDDDQDDFTLNLSEQLALMDSDVLMDDVVVIENSDNELENSVDSTMNAMSMILTFPMLSLSDTPQSNSYITETSNLVDDLKSPPSVISAMKPARETKAKFGRRGRPPKVPCRTNSQSKMPLRSCRYNTTNPKTTVKSRKTEGYTCKLNGTWYQVSLS